MTDDGERSNVAFFLHVILIYLIGCTFALRLRINPLITGLFFQGKLLWQWNISGLRKGLVPSRTNKRIQQVHRNGRQVERRYVVSQCHDRHRKKSPRWSSGSVVTAGTTTSRCVNVLLHFQVHGELRHLIVSRFHRARPSSILPYILLSPNSQQWMGKILRVLHVDKLP